MSVCLLFLTLIRISMKISKDPPKILITDTVNKSKYTNKSQYSLNIERCVCYKPLDDLDSGIIFDFVTGIGDCLYYYAAL